MAPIDCGKFNPYTNKPNPARVTYEPGPIGNALAVIGLALAAWGMTGWQGWGVWFLVVGLGYLLYQAIKAVSGK
jgi:hypothetical protein